MLCLESGGDAPSWVLNFGVFLAGAFFNGHVSRTCVGPSSASSPTMELMSRLKSQARPFCSVKFSCAPSEQLCEAVCLSAFTAREQCDLMCQATCRMLCRMHAKTALATLCGDPAPCKAIAVDYIIVQVN